MHIFHTDANFVAYSDVVQVTGMELDPMHSISADPAGGQ